MGILEFPEAISSAIMRIGMFFDKLYWFFFGIGIFIAFITYVVAFVVLQIVFIYVYYKVIFFAIGLRPRIEQLLRTIDRMFE